MEMALNFQFWTDFDNSDNAKTHMIDVLIGEPELNGAAKKTLRVFKDMDPYSTTVGVFDERQEGQGLGHGQRGLAIHASTWVRSGGSRLNRV